MLSRRLAPWGAKGLVRPLSSQAPPIPFKKIMAANRGEIATRIMRAGTELGLETVGIYSKEDRFTQHRYKADFAYQVGEGKSPIGAYLDIESIVKTAKENGVDAVHPGYGFLSEREDFAAALEAAGVTFVGPTVENLNKFGDKTMARALAIEVGVPVVPGTDGPVTTLEQAREFIEGGDNPVGYPIIIKAAMGGGGKGMRVVQTKEELEENFKLATSEALAAFGDGSIFIERFVTEPRHIEIQILGDGTGDVVHLYDRDCSVQRRHQKVIEVAPAEGLPEDTRQALFDNAKKLTAHAKYRNAGTVEFLVDKEGRFYFIEVNPRVQVEHTVTEEVTGIDIVQSQIRIAGGATLKDLGLSQEKISTQGVAMQCRVTTEDPSTNFTPDTGTIEVFRTPGGMGIRVDDGPGFLGAHITPHYDSLLMKITAHGATREDSAAKLSRALREFRVRGVTTNISFVLNVLQHPEFRYKYVTTSFIAQNPSLMEPLRSQNRGQKLLRFIADMIVNGPPDSLGATGPPPSLVDPIVPSIPPPSDTTVSLKQIFDEKGPEAFAKAVRNSKAALVTDTTWRDAHQSLLATRVRTKDLLTIAPATANALHKAYSLECWGGATFDVSMRFLNECPWDRLEKLREAVPFVPFQMLLRGANGVGYTNYPDNVIYKFCQVAKDTGMDVFRVFDSLNDMDNLRLGIDAVGTAGGIVEGAISYTGDVSDPTRKPYTLEYYLGLVDQLVAAGIHVLAIKDMAGLLKPQAATLLVSAIREAHPDLPIHIHTHDTAGTGVASMLAGLKAGADAVDGAIDAMSGTTSQPSLGAIVESLRGSELDTGISLADLTKLHDYWELARGLYAPFETGQKSGSSDVYVHEMPGGQYTNLLFQATQLGLGDRWSLVKQRYAEANRLLGDIPKVTPSSKVVGDMANFMVQNDLSENDVLSRAESLDFPASVIEYFQGYLGQPPFGFPEPLRSAILSRQPPLPNGKAAFAGRPGEELEAMDFDAVREDLVKRWGERAISDKELMSHAQYPKVFDDFMRFRAEYDDVSALDTRTFLRGILPGETVEVKLAEGKVLYIKLDCVNEVEEDGYRTINFELNGQKRIVRVLDKNSGAASTARPKADPFTVGSVGAPMPGVVVETRAEQGDVVKKGDALVVLSAMKMETAVTAPVGGVIRTLAVVEGDSVKGGDLIAEIDEN